MTKLQIMWSFVGVILLTYICFHPSMPPYVMAIPGGITGALIIRILKDEGKL